MNEDVNGSTHDTDSPSVNLSHVMNGPSGCSEISRRTGVQSTHGAAVGVGPSFCLVGPPPFPGSSPSAARTAGPEGLVSERPGLRPGVQPGQSQAECLSAGGAGLPAGAGTGKSHVVGGQGQGGQGQPGREDKMQVRKMELMDREKQGQERVPAMLCAWGLTQAHPPRPRSPWPLASWVMSLSSLFENGTNFLKCSFQFGLQKKKRLYNYTSALIPPFPSEALPCGAHPGRAQRGTWERVPCSPVYSSETLEMT